MGKKNEAKKVLVVDGEEFELIETKGRYHECEGGKRFRIGNLSVTIEERKVVEKPVENVENKEEGDEHGDSGSELQPEAMA